MIEARKQAGMNNYYDNPYELFEWWISDAAQEEPVDENQIYLEGYER
jgi:hypothetical protein